MMDALIKQTKKANKNDLDLLGKIFSEKGAFQKNDVDILKIIKNYLNSILIGLLTKFLVKIEKNNVLCTILNLKNMDEKISEYLKKLFFDYLDSIEFKNIPIQKINQIPLILGINLPFFVEINKIIIYYNNNIKEKYSILKKIYVIYQMKMSKKQLKNIMKIFIIYQIIFTMKF